MILSNCIIKKNPKDNPIYPYAKSEYYFELTDEKFYGVCFNFGEINVIEHNKQKRLVFDYNILHIPEKLHDIGVSELLDSEIESIVGNVLNEIIERGYYEFDTKR